MSSLFKRGFFGVGGKYLTIISNYCKVLSNPPRNLIKCILRNHFQYFEESDQMKCTKLKSDESLQENEIDETVILKYIHTFNLIISNLLVLY